MLFGAEIETTARDRIRRYWALKTLPSVRQVSRSIREDSAQARELPPWIPLPAELLVDPKLEPIDTYVYAYIVVEGMNFAEKQPDKFIPPMLRLPEQEVGWARAEMGISKPAWLASRKRLIRAGYLRDVGHRNGLFISSTKQRKSCFEVFKNAAVQHAER